MIPVLFAEDTTSFTTNGLGALANCISCKVTEKRNGEYTLTMQYPLDGIHFEDIKNDSIIWAKPSDGANNQAFRVYKIKKPINGIVTIEAEHVSYQLSKIPTMPFTASSCVAALQGLKDNAAEACPFTFYTNKQTIATYTQDQPASIRSRLGGVEGSILDVYGGEYEFDNYDVHLWNSRGQDRGVEIRYGKNLKDITQEENIQNVITGIVPFWANEETLVVLPEKVVESEYASLYSYPRTVIHDFSQEWQEAPTVEQLRQRAQQYINDNDIGIPKISISVSFIALWQTEEYKNIAPLERIKLCDTVTIIFDKLGIRAKAKVITTEYDVLNERYNKIEVGDAKSTLASTIVNIDETTNTKIVRATSYMEKAIVHATELITGGLGGYVYLKPNANGYPEEILIMDSPDIETAVNVWRWNKNGLGFSSTGYSGTYGTAITSDGRIVADFITAGTLSGDLIQAGTVSANALTVEAKEELEMYHDYLPYDIYTNVNRWEINQKAVQIATVSHAGEIYTALLLDGQDISQYNPGYQTQVKSDFTGKPTLNIDFDYFFFWDTTIAEEQEFFYLYFYDIENRRYFLSYWTIPAGFYRESQTYHFHVENFVLNFKSDINVYVPRIGFRFVPNTIMYIANFKVNGLTSDYNSTSVSTTANGLSAIVRSGSVISSINQSAETVSIEARKINLTGDLSLRGDFKSYNPNDNLKYCHLDSGNISFYAGGNNVFTISSQAILGQYAGIFFGDVDDPSSMADYTYIEQNIISTPEIYCKGDGRFDSEVGYTLRADNYSRLGGVTADYLYITGTQAGASVISSFHGGVKFYSNVFDANGGTQFISDRRKKRNIVGLAIDKARSFIMSLRPVKFRFTKDISESNRYHHGFIAQEVKKAMPEDWGVYCEDKENKTIGIRYHELIADMVALIQDHEKRIQELEDERNKK